MSVKDLTHFGFNFVVTHQAHHLTQSSSLQSSLRALIMHALLHDLTACDLGQVVRETGLDVHDIYTKKHAWHFAHYSDRSFTAHL